MSERAERTAAVAIVAALFIGGLFLVYRLVNPPTGDYLVKVALRDADGLHKDSEVKIGGVAGGVIKKLKYVHHPDGRDTALATLALDDAAAPIGAGARAVVRPVNLLGEKFLDLQPGDRRRPMPSGSSIAMARTGTSVDLVDVLSMLDPQTRTRIGILINEAGVALGGRGGDLADVLSRLPTSLDKSRQVLAEIEHQDAALRGLIVNSDRVLGPLAAHGDDLGRLVGAAKSALAVTASRNAELGRTMAKAPAALADLQGTLGRLETTAARLTPAATQLQRTAAPLADTLAALPGFASSAHDALDTVRSVAPTVNHLATRATPTVQRLQPTLARVNALMRSAEPSVRQLEHDNGLNTLLYFVQTWARVVKPEDGLGHTFGAHLIIDPGYFGAVLDKLNQGPDTPTDRRGRSGRRPASRLRAPAERLPSVGLKPLVKNLTEGVTGAVEKVGKAVDNVVKGVVPPVGGGPGPSNGDSTIGLLDYLLGK